MKNERQILRTRRLSLFDPITTLNLPDAASRELFEFALHGDLHTISDLCLNSRQILSQGISLPSIKEIEGALDNAGLYLGMQSHELREYQHRLDEELYLEHTIDNQQYEEEEIDSYLSEDRILVSSDFVRSILDFVQLLPSDHLLTLKDINDVITHILNEELLRRQNYHLTHP